MLGMASEMQAGGARGRVDYRVEEQLDPFYCMLMKGVEVRRVDKSLVA